MTRLVAPHPSLQPPAWPALSPSLSPSLALSLRLPRPRPLVLSLLLWAAASASASGCSPAPGVLACQDLGSFTASALRVQLTQKNQGPVAWRTVRTTLRLANTSEQPLVLALRQGSLKVADENGNAYDHGRPKATGIGSVTRDGADTQFVLAPGQARELSLETVLQYRSDKVVAGQLLSHELALVELNAVSPTQVSALRDHLVSLAALPASGGAGMGQLMGSTGAAVAAGAAPAPLIDSAVKLLDALRKKH